MRHTRITPPTPNGVHVCRQCGLETPASGDNFYYPETPACRHYNEGGFPDTDHLLPAEDDNERSNVKVTLGIVKRA